MNAKFNQSRAPMQKKALPTLSTITSIADFLSAFDRCCAVRAALFQHSRAHDDAARRIVQSWATKPGFRPDLCVHKMNEHAADVVSPLNSDFMLLPNLDDGFDALTALQFFPTSMAPSAPAPVPRQAPPNGLHPVGGAPSDKNRNKWVPGTPFPVIPAGADGKPSVTPGKFCFDHGFCHKYNTYANGCTCQDPKRLHVCVGCGAEHPGLPDGGRHCPKASGKFLPQRDKRR
jgi:hypothetical protein